MSYLDHLITLPQQIAPHHALSRIAGRIARSRNKLLKELLIRVFLLRYDVDIGEAERTQLSEYDSFNDFFTRALRSGARPIPKTTSAVACPADGTISQLGNIDDSSLVQAKGRFYSLGALLGGSDSDPQRFNNGTFATIYLAPHNYHRVHAPVSGTITRIRYVPGRLFSVNDRTARCVDRLFAHNERIIVEISSDAGMIVVILVGAMLVASMELTCCNVEAAIKMAGKTTAPYLIEPNKPTAAIERGAELGRFNMGSTVIILAEPGRLDWDPTLGHGSPVEVGQTLGSIKTTQQTPI